MILEAQYDRVGRGFEGIFADALDDVLELYLRGERVTVVYDWFAVGTVPAVELQAPAPFQ